MTSMTPTAVDPQQTVPAERLSDPEVQRALVRAALYELLSLAFVYPEAETVERSLALAADLAEHPLLRDGGLLEPLERYRDAIEVAGLGPLGPCYLELFEGDALCSLHETEYLRDPFARPPGLADIAGFYKAFGFRISSTHPSAPDHVATELEFLSLLARKRAYVLLRRGEAEPGSPGGAADAWGERERVTHEATRSFLLDHVGRWMPAVTAALIERAAELPLRRPGSGAQGEGVYAAAADLLRGQVATDLAREGLRPQPLGPRRSDPQDAEAMVCPMTVADESADGPVGSV